MAGASASYSAFKGGDDSGDDNANVRLGGLSAGAEAGMGVGGITANYSASIEAVSAKAGPVRAKIGLDGGSGVTVGVDGIETKVAGFGISVGKKTGISTPIGELAVDTDDCVVQ